MDAALEQETIEIARDLIRIESVNTGDPATIGDGEERAARYVRDRLDEVGIAGEFVLPTPGRGNLVVRIPGRDRAAGALLVHAHLDVVPEIAYSIGAGGDIVVGAGRGPSAAAPSWRIGIEDPRRPGAVAQVVTVRRGAVATSGSAARGAHVIDPRTGRGIVRSGSATVVGPDLLWADVWATAAWVAPARAERLMSDRAPAYSLLMV